MAGFKDSQVKVVSMDSDTIFLQVGPEGLSFPMEEFKQVCKGLRKDLRHLIFNIAVRLNLDSVDLTNNDAIKQAIEKATFKF